jgi:hypothetical protein
MTIKNSLKYLILTLAVLAMPFLSMAQQNTLVQTTLSAAVAAPTQTSSTPGNPVLVQLASVTGITAPTLNSSGTINRQSQWVVFIDREAILVTGLNGTTVQGTRGYNSTVATAHVSGTMVLYGRAEWMYQNDPGAVTVADGSVSGVPCTAASVFVTPWLNIRSGAQWICSTVTGTWVPGWNNNGIPIATATVASLAGATLPSGPFFSVSGTNAITSWTIPLGFNGTAFGGGCFTTIPTGIFTWTAAGNIAIAGTSTAVNIPITWCWNAVTSKWQPSRIA